MMVNFFTWELGYILGLNFGLIFDFRRLWGFEFAILLTLVFYYINLKDQLNNRGVTASQREGKD